MAGRHERVAVIVVHGVADQAPNESVRRVANLLASVTDANAGRPAYSAFVEQPFRIPVRPPVSKPVFEKPTPVPQPVRDGLRRAALRVRGAVPSSVSASFAKVASPLRRSVSTPVGSSVQRVVRRVRRPAPATPPARSFYDLCKPPPPTNKRRDAGYLFSAAVLDAYKPEGPSATYDTVCLSATRQGAGAPVDVDLFEMYWADLSRVGTSWWRILGEVYQVLLHLPSLGMHAASASVANTNVWTGRFFQPATWAASWLLSSPIVVFNVYFLVAAALVLLGLLPGERHRLIAASVAGLFAFGVVVWLWLKHLDRRLAWRLVVSGLVAGTVGAALACGNAVDNGWAKLLGLETLLAGLALLAFPLLKAYNAYRDGIKWVAIPAGLVTFLSAVAAFNNPAPGTPAFAFTAAVGFRIVEIVGAILFGLWILFFLSLYGSILFGTLYAVSGAREGTGRAVRTAVVSLAVPAFSLLVLTVSLWAGLFWALDSNATTTAPFDQPYRVWPGVASLPFIGPELDPVRNGRMFVTAILKIGLGVGFLGTVALVALGSAIVIVPLVPIVFAEVRPRRTNDLCRNEGRWLSGTYRALYVAGPLIVAGVALMPLWKWLAGDAYDRLLSPNTIVEYLGLAVAGTATGLIGFRGRLKTLSGGFRAPVDVMLDVDGYLREHPVGAAPRAGIFARYFSLLLHISARRYDRIVLVAHSQGTVITADLLRYLTGLGNLLNRTVSPIAHSHVKLFTMGSPLRQLYARRFPELYDWVQCDSQQFRIGVYPDAPDIDSNAKPDPAELGVSEWVNAYRSGDYVGRWLWRADKCDCLFDAKKSRGDWTSIPTHLPGSRDANGSRREFCIGAGAHTHYGDHTAPEIAVELDYLIRM